ncbi:DUF6387 family protein [Stenotrophomonas pavanii]|uniref:DUF6387 family protein n=1 Tax=Stenotrophomonas maltophilia group TaxID=995085 RepID=UPI0006C37720|nr:hypothetical protein VO93_18295 [Stenotrophomonas maltophilia]MBN5175634.1 hypothetical protein [Stenotrophomonas maltophilia]
MARTKSASRIPDWFDLNAYGDLTDFATEDWLNLLVELSIVSDVSEILHSVVEDDAEHRVELEKMFSNLQKSLGRQGHEWWKEKYASNPEVYAFGSVASITNWTVAQMAARLEQLEGSQDLVRSSRRVIECELSADYEAWLEAKDQVRTYEEFGRIPFFVALRDSPEFAKSALPLTNNRAVAIDLSVPDATIRQDFDKWLAAMRQLDSHRAAKRPFSRADYSRWIQSGYVPLLVLDHWRRLTGEKITYGDMCDAAFPAGRRVEVDDIRKTLLPNARAWASKENIEALAVQAANEDAAQMQENSGGEKSSGK